MGMDLHVAAGEHGTLVSCELDESGHDEGGIAWFLYCVSGRVVVVVVLAECR